MNLHRDPSKVGEGRRPSPTRLAAAVCVAPAADGAPPGARKSDLNDAIFDDSLRKLDKIPLRWEGRFRAFY